MSTFTSILPDTEEWTTKGDDTLQLNRSLDKIDHKNLSGNLKIYSYPRYRSLNSIVFKNPSDFDYFNLLMNIHEIVFNNTLNLKSAVGQLHCSHFSSQSVEMCPCVITHQTVTCPSFLALSIYLWKYRLLTWTSEVERINKSSFLSFTNENKVFPNTRRQWHYKMLNLNSTCKENRKHRHVDVFISITLVWISNLKELRS